MEFIAEIRRRHLVAARVLAQLPAVLNYLVKIGDDCRDAGGRATQEQFAEDVIEQLDVEPAKFFVHRHLCPVGIFARNTPAASVKPSPFCPAGITTRSRQRQNQESIPVGLSQ